MCFVAASFAHMQMCGCALRLWLHAHVHGCALRRGALAHAHIRGCALRLGAPAHVQMHGCVLRLGAPAHMQMHGCAIRRRTACTYADARLCASPWSARTCADARLYASSLDRSHICIRTAMRFDAESLVHMHTHGYALRRGIACTYAYARLRAPSHGVCMTDGAHIKTRHFDRLGLVHAARKLALKSL